MKNQNQNTNAQCSVKNGRRWDEKDKGGKT